MRVAARGFGFHQRDGVGAVFQRLLEIFGFRASADVEALNLLAIGADEAGFEAVATRREKRRDQRPVFARHEFLDLKLAVADALRIGRPTYIRLGKKGEPQVHETPPAFAIGRGITMRAGRDVAILSVGNMLAVAMQAADALERQGCSAEVVSMHTVKPLDEALLERTFADKKLVVVLEEHALAGGAGSAVLEWGNTRGVDLRKLVCVAGPDRFLSACGGQTQARIEIGLTTADVVARITSRLS